MINRLIEWSLRNRFLVVCGVFFLAAFGTRALYRTPVDAIPDLSENQVIVFADWPGRSPQEVEDQVTYPLSVGLQGLAGVKTVRANSMFGFTMLTIIFEEKLDNYFARTRVLERLNLLAAQLPAGVVPQLGPDATGLGWVYQYYLHVDPVAADVRRRNSSDTNDVRLVTSAATNSNSQFAIRNSQLESEPPHVGTYDLGQLRALQDWFIRYQLNAVQGVAEVASIGGFVRQYQIEVSSLKMRARKVTLKDVMDAVGASNLNVGGKVIEENGMEFVVRGLGLVKSLADLENIVLMERGGVPIYLKDVATVQIGGDFRRGTLDVDGREVVGGIVVMRNGENALATINRVKEKIRAIQISLPPGVTIKSFYDRAELIERTIDTLKHALAEEILLVTLAHIIFLWHFRSILIVTVPLPLSILVSFILMEKFGISSNIMSLSGIAIAIGVLVDAGIVMTENVIRHCERAEEEKQRKCSVISIQPSVAAGAPSAPTAISASSSLAPTGEEDRGEGANGTPSTAASPPAAAPLNTVSLTTDHSTRLTAEETLAVVLTSAQQVGRPIFFAMVIIILAFLPVFALSGQEGKLFHPLAFTKTFAMIGSTLLAVTIVPVLCSFLVRGPFHSEDRNWVMRVLLAIYDPILDLALRWRKTVMAGAAVLLVFALLIAFGIPRPAMLWLARTTSGQTVETVRPPSTATDTRLKSGANESSTHAGHGSAASAALKTDPLNTEHSARLLADFTARHPAFTKLFAGFGKDFMPTLNEGSLLFMPVLLPSTSLTEVKRVMSWQDRVIRSLPEVESVGGKLGRAETATDPAPVEMIETTIMLKPEWLPTNRTYLGFIKIPTVYRNPAWRPDSTKETLIAELTEKLSNVPGYVPGFLQPIENRILMLSTGIRAQLGVKILGGSLDDLQRKAFEVERIVREVPGAVGVAPSRVQGKPYLEVEVNRVAMARFGLRAADVLDAVETGLGGKVMSTTYQAAERVDPRERTGIQVRLQRDERDDLERLGDVLVAAPGGKHIPLGQLASIRRATGPSEIASENGRLRVFVQANVQDRDLTGFVEDVKRRVEKEIVPTLPPGMTIEYSGEYENLVRAQQTLYYIFPATLLIIFLLLYMVYHSAKEAAHVILAVPFALTGGVFLQYALGYNFSVSVWVGYIALFGTAIQTGVVMVVYLEEMVAKKQAERAATGQPFTRADLIQAIKDGARLRLRPKVMTVATIVASLLPIMWSHCPGSEVMQPLATPVIGGMVSSLLHILVVTPVIFAMLRERELKRNP
jgi:Cu(I)/Ag(I) efflux system membrane protein CusA/SilA